MTPTEPERIWMGWGLMDDLQQDPPLGRRRPRLPQITITARWIESPTGHFEMSEQQGARFSHGSTQKKHTPAPDAESAGRQAALDRALDQIEKTYGKGSIMRSREMA